MDFKSANNIAHPVENEYHYKLLTKYGFVCNDPAPTGFVRKYKYTNGNKDITVCIGASADYFEGFCGFGYMSKLETELKKYIS